MVDADEETALLSSARDAAGRVEPPRRRGRVVASVLVLVGALALVAAAGRGAADSETHRPTRVLEMAMGLGKEKGLDIVGQEAENEIKQSSNQLAAGLLRRRHVSGDYSWQYGGARWTQ